MRCCSAAARRSSSVDTPSSSCSRRTVFAPSPGIRVTSISDAGNFAFSFVGRGDLAGLDQGDDLRLQGLADSGQLASPARPGPAPRPRPGSGGSPAPPPGRRAPGSGSRRRARTGSRARPSPRRSRRFASARAQTLDRRLCPAPSRPSGWSCRPTTRPTTSRPIVSRDRRPAARRAPDADRRRQLARRHRRDRRPARRRARRRRGPAPRRRSRASARPTSTGFARRSRAALSWSCRWTPTSRTTRPICPRLLDAAAERPTWCSARATSPAAGSPTGARCGG